MIVWYSGPRLCTVLTPVRVAGPGWSVRRAPRRPPHDHLTDLVYACTGAVGTGGRETRESSAQAKEPVPTRRGAADPIRFHASRRACAHFLLHPCRSPHGGRLKNRISKDMWPHARARGQTTRYQMGGAACYQTEKPRKRRAQMSHTKVCTESHARGVQMSEPH